MLVFAAEKGLTLADPYAIGLAFAGLAVLAAVGALSHQGDRAFSASLIYLGLGAVGAAAVELLGVRWLQPIDDAAVVEKLTELAVVVALFGAGLRLERPLRLREWSSPLRLLLVAMPVTIAGVALFGLGPMGLSLGAAVALGAILAPTDPVLAADIGVGPPGDEDEREPNFALTGEAGGNDGLAFPFVFLGLFIAERGGSDWLGTWLLADVLYGIVVGAALGAAVGWGVAALVVPLRDRRLLSHELDGWLGLAAVLLVYGICEVAGAYGFLAAFAGGLAFRRFEHGHEYNARVHHGAETVEKFGELAVILLLGTFVGASLVTEPGLGGWLLVPALLLALRPAAVLLALVRSRLVGRERLFVAWFGVRGIGSIYYAAVVAGAGVLSPEETRVVVWTAILCVAVSIVVHGASAAPLSRRIEPAAPDEAPPARTAAEGSPTPAGRTTSST